MGEGLGMFAEVALATVLGGAACALVGFFLTGMRLPFLGVCLSHAALAGAVGAQWAGWPPLPVAFAASVATAFLVGPVADAARLDATTSLGILFSLMMGAAFLFIGLMPGPRTEALGLLWGSVLFVTPADLRALAACVALATGFTIAFGKELRAVWFSRTLAASAGIRATLVFYLLLLVAGAVVTVNLEIVGGLMLYALLVTPAAAANLLARSYLGALLWALSFGVVGSLGGLVASYLFDTPVGASLVVVLAALFGACLVADRTILRRRR